MLTDLPQSTFHNRLQAELDFLFGRINYERTSEVTYPRHFKLDSMRRLLQLLGNPQDACSIVHVAGTKGKGSVCKMIAAALNESGILTGVYSSPHIESICERITVGGKCIGEDQLAALLARIRAAVERLDRTSEQMGYRKNSFFEILTAASLLHFKDCNVETIVLETGLGGRLDSTNVCDPELCVITNISLDHTRQLGSTVDKIAREKAGIVKRGIPVVSGVTDKLAAREISEAVAVNATKLVKLGEDFHCVVKPGVGDGMSIQFDTYGLLPGENSYEMSGVQVSAVGAHQAENAAVAVAALQWLRVLEYSSGRSRISESSIRRAMNQFSLIGRSEVITRFPLVVVDMAHNVASAEALVDSLHRLHHARKVREGRRCLVFASSCDKDLKGMLSCLLPCFDEVVFTRFVQNPRATDPRQLRDVALEIAAEGGPQPELTIQPDPVSTWSTLQKSLTGQDFLCVAGSAFLIAELRPLIVRKPPG